MYSLALEIVDDLTSSALHPKENTQVCELLDVLADAVDTYKTVHYPT